MSRSWHNKNLSPPPWMDRSDPPSSKVPSASQFATKRMSWLVGTGTSAYCTRSSALAEDPERDVDHVDAECVEVLGDGNDLVVELLEVQVTGTEFDH